MPASYWLLGLVAVLMLGDLWSTIVGLDAGCGEANAVANALLGRWGVLGLCTYGAASFGIVALFVVCFPDQWGMPLLFAVETAVLVAQNVHLTRKTRAAAAHPS